MTMELRPLSKTAAIIVHHLLKVQSNHPIIRCPSTGLQIIANTRHEVAQRLVPNSFGQHYYWMGYFYVLAKKPQRYEVHIFDEETGEFLGHATAPDKFYHKLS